MFIPTQSPLIVSFFGYGLLVSACLVFLLVVILPSKLSFQRIGKVSVTARWFYKAKRKTDKTAEVSRIHSTSGRILFVETREKPLSTVETRKKGMQRRTDVLAESIDEAMI